MEYSKYLAYEIIIYKCIKITNIYGNDLNIYI